MVATVTGVAPFVSMLRYWLEGPADDRRMYVLEGVSFIDEFGYDEELRALAARHPNVRFVPTCSRPDDPRNAGWTGQTGRVHTIVEHYVREWAARAGRDLHLCLRASGNDRGFARPLRGQRLRVRGRALLEAALDASADPPAVQFRFRSGGLDERSVDGQAARRGVRALARSSRSLAAAAAAMTAVVAAAAPPPPASGWVAGSFLPAASFAGKCVNPRSGTNPQTGLPVQRHPAARRPTRTTGCARGVTISTFGTTRSSIAIRAARDAGLLRSAEDARDHGVGTPKGPLPLYVSDGRVAQPHPVGHRGRLRSELGRSSPRCRRGASSSPIRMPNSPASGRSRNAARSTSRRRHRRRELTLKLDRRISGRALPRVRQRNAHVHLRDAGRRSASGPFTLQSTAVTKSPVPCQTCRHRPDRRLLWCSTITS